MRLRTGLYINERGEFYAIRENLNSPRHDEPPEPCNIFVLNLGTGSSSTQLCEWLDGQLQTGWLARIDQDALYQAMIEHGDVVIAGWRAK